MMSEATRARLFDYQQAFAHPVTRVITIAVVALLVLAPLLIGLLSAARRIPQEQQRELWKRYLSWLWLTPLLMVPVLLGAAWTMAAVTSLSLLCHREFSRVTGLSASKIIQATVYAGILAVACAALDHWYGFFVALFPLTVCVISAIAILPDQPAGYIQRVALGVFGFMLFGCALGHLSYLANDRAYRPMLMLLVLSVELNDVFAYCSGKLFGHRKLAPRTSPNKTVGGSLGALLLTTVLVTVVGRAVFRGTALESIGHLVVLGLLVSLAGQLGDLMLSSIKRDLGIKDMGTTIPGHGGLLDRFDSIILAAPTFFHYVHYFVGIGLE